MNRPSGEQERGGPLPAGSAASDQAAVNPAVADEVAAPPQRRQRTRRALSATLASLLVFGLLAWLVATGRTTGLDLDLTQGIQRHNHPLLTALMEFVSLFGYPPFNWLTVGAVAAVFIVLGLRLEAAFAVIAAAGAGLLSTVVKILWVRPRPTAEGVLVIGTSSGYSFPSGHVVLYVAFFGFLLYWVYANLKPGVVRRSLVVTLGLLIALVGPSRVYLGQHWASDALGGYALGLLYLILLIQVYAATALRTRARGARRLVTRSSLARGK